ncbi:MAG TPA: hypothetical protein V6C91_21775 [Coleofasciculaceae cyanobacterium]
MFDKQLIKGSGMLMLSDNLQRIGAIIRKPRLAYREKDRIAKQTAFPSSLAKNGRNAVGCLRRVASLSAVVVLVSDYLLLTGER